jgi:hypothetical protein
MDVEFHSPAKCGFAFVTGRDGEHAKATSRVANGAEKEKGDRTRQF